MEAFISIQGPAAPLMLDNVDTDVIIPARYLVTTDPAELSRHALEDLLVGACTAICVWRRPPTANRLMISSAVTP